jgi:hypothetical protein
MTPAKLRLAQAAMAKRDTKVGDLCEKLGGSARRSIASYGAKRQLMKEQETNIRASTKRPTWSQVDPLRLSAVRSTLLPLLSQNT